MCNEKSYCPHLPLAQMHSYIYTSMDPWIHLGMDSGIT